MFQAFPGDYDSGSRCSSSPSAESQYLSSVDSFGSPPTATASQECAGLGEMPGSFVPTVTAITTSQDLQWLVQPTLISSMAQSQGQPLASQPPVVDPYDMPGTSYSTPGMSGYSSGGASGSGGPSTSGTTSGPGPARPARARPRRPREETETDQLEEEKAELESEIAELQKEKERLEFVLVAHKPGCKIPYEEGPGPGPLAEVRDLPGSAPAKEDGFSWLLPPPPPPPLPFQTSQDAPPNLTASLFTHSEVQVLGDPFPVVNPSYTSSFVLTCPEVSAFAGAQRTSGSDQPSDPLNSPSLLAL
ncbi:protein fosB isoform X2 [Papio anubis]|uniref:FosB proto-onco, AP-1 transcription factor subunit n=8 Tax=Cercopithecidae TaxID=9527 RepID=A0A2K5NRT4_CERAT|nr:PREDICTED: protein fosB isoform X2 [Colobus angolensis palliatus]XP_011830486.1 PREDICTED: protein fosB isoform X2 [Mandrillus leucophaeus]XP_021786890.1 protein fosB isoform X2 [Papio anubis]XP_024647617.1 protein fosB isoform X2 [Macaca nemestrina]XP_025225141.1 protein fosB isoform X2 [Theropithecus gelada]XP_045236000.1 protein fosB isoform X2 [Macaca fascicularis]